MVNIDIRKQLPYDAIVLENYAFDNAIVGVTLDGKAIYCFQLMIEELVGEGFDELEAIEWIEYNTIRSLPYMGEKAPVIMYSCDGVDYD